MMKYENEMGALGAAIRNLAIALKEMPPYMDGFIVDAGEYDAMKNCVNCCHYDVCVVVHDRKNRRAGDYSPCSKWKLVEK